MAGSSKRSGSLKAEAAGDQGSAWTVVPWEK